MVTRKVYKLHVSLTFIILLPDLSIAQWWP